MVKLDDRHLGSTATWIGALMFLVLAPGTTALAQDRSGEPPDPKELEAVCREVLCREPHTVRLKIEGDKEFEGGPSYPTPIVTGSLVTVLAGETVMVEASLESGRLVDVKAVAELTHPDRTIILSLRQEPSIGDGLGMIMTIESPFPGVLKYRLGIMSPSDSRLKRTSVCPLEQHITSYEQWPYPLFLVAATDFEQVDPSSDEARQCR